MIEEIEINNLDEMSLFVRKYRSKSSGVANLLELIQLAKTRSESILLLSLKAQDQIIAISLFQLSERRYLSLNYKSMHLYGFDFYDYNSLNIQERYELQFLRFIKRCAKKNYVQLIILENIQNKLGCKHNYQRIQLFDSLKSDNGFDYIIAKKRLKRYKKKLKQLFEYTVSHYTGNQITESLIDELACLHKERWEFDNIKSAFLDKKRKQNYLVGRKNKVLTVISTKDSILAVHYGVIFNNCLLFHTPVINIKYYEYSPHINFIEMLILETALYCKENQIQVLDFGLGNEAYKNKYTNDYKDVFTYSLPLGIISIIRFKVLAFIKKLGVKDLLNSIYKMYNKIEVMYNKINVYEFELNTSSKKVSKDFYKIKNYSDFVSLYRKLGYPVRRYHYNRFNKGDYFYYLLKENHVYSSAWLTSQDLHVLEVNKVLQVSGNVIYDYHTIEESGGDEKHQELLDSIISHLSSHLFIYTLTNNKALNRLIQKVGFKKSLSYQLR